MENKSFSSLFSNAKLANDDKKDSFETKTGLSNICFCEFSRGQSLIEEIFCENLVVR